MRLARGEVKKQVKASNSALRAVRRSEHDEQRDLFLWAELAKGQHPALSLMFAIPNGGHRHKAVAAKLKAEGVKSGVPDVFLPVARGPWHGLFIEMKRADASPSDTSVSQVEWHIALAGERYKPVTCRGFEEARAAILNYLTL